MNATRIELAIDESEWLAGEGDETTCDDVRTAWLCAELNRGLAGFDALWTDR